MNELIKVTENGKGEQSVDARELHGFMESRQDFSDWIKGRTLKYGFIDSTDFSINLGKTISNTGRPRKEYILTLDMAKELAMVENNSKGKEARQYFIAVEKAFKEQYMTSIPNIDSKFLLQMSKQMAQLEESNKLMEPKAEFYDQVTGSSDVIDMKDTAKILHLGVGRNTLFSFLRGKGILDPSNQPYQTYIDRGYFRVVESKYVLDNGSVRINKKTVVFQKGLDFIFKKYREDNSQNDLFGLEI